MKMRSFKTMAFWFAAAAMASSSGAFAHHSHHSHKHHHSHSCVLPFSKNMARDFNRNLATALHIILNDLNDVFVAEAFANHPINLMTNTHLVELINAVNGTGAGSIGQSVNLIEGILLELGVDANLMIAFKSAFTAMIAAAEQYSLAVANGGDSSAVFNTWVNAGKALAGILDEILGYVPGSNAANNLEALITALITDQANAVQAFNGVLASSALLPGETQSQAALRFDQDAHRLASNLAFIIVGQSVENANHAACPNGDLMIVEAP